ncbi:ABC transporter substrate-binding protein [bacterium]|nr:ABC transporter substrate-binding protein [bacterium]
MSSKKVVRIAQWQRVILPYLPLYIADVAGYFTELGIKVRIDPVGNDDQVFREVLKGKAMIGIGDPTFCARIENQSQPVKVIATLVERAAMWGLTENPIVRPIERVEDLVHLRVGTYPQPSTSYALLASLKAKHSRLLKSFKIIEGPIEQQIQLFKKDKCDIVTDNEPFISIAEDQGLRIVYSSPEFHAPLTFTGAYMRLSTITEDPETVANFVTGIEKGLSAVRKDKKLALHVAKKLYPDVGERILSNALQRLRAAKIWGRDAFTSEENWSEALRIRKLLGGRFLRNPQQAVVNDFTANYKKTYLLPSKAKRPSKNS